ncbi:hypothetical protein PAHAL_5G537000 [Panicum hallii]|uniref:Uncharacterized protein n=1 Tax=Panicum hallii TaxID=206008 RepID=A0A2T8IPG7_9POAL|nr:hypothetical protein PAHAL_5G537000 [Panicum hallii]
MDELPRKGLGVPCILSHHPCQCIIFPCQLVSLHWSGSSASDPSPQTLAYVNKKGFYQGYMYHNISVCCKLSTNKNKVYSFLDSKQD